VKQSLPVLLVFFFSTVISGEDWPQWRGPNQNGSSPEKKLPAEWNDEKNVVWKAQMPGYSAATPVICKGRVFVSSGDSNMKLHAICLDEKTGEILWSRPAGKDCWFRGKRHNGASPSAVTDGKTVCFLFGTGPLLSFNFEGRQLWSRNFTEEYGPFCLMWGYGSSPLLLDGKLYIPILQNKTPGAYGEMDNRRAPLKSYLLALNLEDGKTDWEHERKSDMRGETCESYITPMAMEQNGKNVILVNAAEYLTGHLAETGEELWRWRFSPSLDSRNQRTVSSITVDGDVLFFGRPKCSLFYAVKPGDGKDVLSNDILQWKFSESSSDATSPLLYGGRIYLLNGRGRDLSCLDPKSGKVYWSKSLEVRSDLRASPTGADGKVYCLTMRGEAIVVEAADEYKVIARNRMKETGCRASIAIANGRLFIRTPGYVYCIGK